MKRGEMKGVSRRLITTKPSNGEIHQKIITGRRSHLTVERSPPLEVRGFRRPREFRVFFNRFAMDSRPRRVVSIVNTSAERLQQLVQRNWKVGIYRDYCPPLLYCYDVNRNKNIFAVSRTKLQSPNSGDTVGTPRGKFEKRAREGLNVISQSEGSNQASRQTTGIKKTAMSVIRETWKFGSYIIHRIN